MLSSLLSKRLCRAVFNYVSISLTVESKSLRIAEYSQLWLVYNHLEELKKLGECQISNPTVTGSNPVGVTSFFFYDFISMS